MIQTCRYCLTQKRSCDSCGQDVISRTITEKLPNRPYNVMATFLLCSNLECKFYGVFLKETSADIQTFVCDSPSCMERQRYYSATNPDVLDQLTHKEGS